MLLDLEGNKRSYLLLPVYYYLSLLTKVSFASYDKSFASYDLGQLL